MGQNSPVHNQSSTSSIREEDSIDISEQASTTSSPAWKKAQDPVKPEERSCKEGQEQEMLEHLGAEMQQLKSLLRSSVLFMK